MPKRTWTRTPAFWACCAGVAAVNAHWAAGWLVDYLDSSGSFRNDLDLLHVLALGPALLVSYHYPAAIALALACYASAVAYTSVAFWQRTSLRRGVRILGLSDLSALFRNYAAH